MTTEYTSADDATRRDGSALSEGLGQGLLPCRACGGKPYAYDMRGIMHEPACTMECGSCDHDVEADTPEAAAAKWHAARA